MRFALDDRKFRFAIESLRFSCLRNTLLLFFFRVIFFFHNRYVCFQLECFYSPRVINFDMRILWIPITCDWSSSADLTDVFKNTFTIRNLEIGGLIKKPFIYLNRSIFSLTSLSLNRFGITHSHKLKRRSILAWIYIHTLKNNKKRYEL